MHKSLKQKTEECIALLRSTNRDKIEDLIIFITRMGYFEAPGSLKHHRFEGGLVSHSLETYHKAYRHGAKACKEGGLVAVGPAQRKPYARAYCLSEGLPQ